MSDHTIPVPRTAAWADRAIAAGIAALALAVYTATMYPGLGGGGDAAKFQFLGRVLGTAHAPGYPTYVLVSHVFSWLPVGTLAHRITLLSAVCAALGSVVVYLTVRRLGGGRAAACVAALGLAFGRNYWAKGAMAEVYALAALLTSVALLKVTDWARTRRPRDFYASVAVVALAFGNHLTIAFIVPALVVFVLLVDARAALRPRVILVAGLIITAGVSQYLFVWLRTVQQAPYLEAQARSFPELLAVITARKYAYQMWAFDGATLLEARVPAVFALVRAELAWAGLGLLVAGIAVTARRQWRHALLFAFATAGLLLVTLTVDADIDGFVVPLFVTLWPVAGLGAHALLSQGERWLPRPAAAAAGAVAVIAVAAAQLHANFAANDHHRRQYEDVYLAALFRALPERSVLANEDYRRHQLILYKLLGEGSAGGRDIRLSGVEPAALWDLFGAGYEVFAFDEERRTLAADGFEFTPVQLYGATLPEFVATLEKGATVAVAASPGVMSGLAAELPGGALRRMGGTRRLAGTGHHAVAVIGAVGSSSGAVEILSEGVAEVSLVHGAPVGTTGVTSPAALTVRADVDAAAVVVNGQTRVEVKNGLAVVAIAASGRIAAVGRLEPALSPRVLVDMSPMPLFRVSVASRCADFGNRGWIDLSELPSNRIINVRIDNYRPFDASAQFYLVGDQGLSPVVTGFEGPGVPTTAVTVFDAADARHRQALARAMAADEVPDGLSAVAAGGRVVARVTLGVNDRGQSATLHLDVGARPLRVIGRARVDLDNPRRAQLCVADKR